MIAREAAFPVAHQRWERAVGGRGAATRGHWKAVEPLSRRRSPFLGRGRTGAHHANLVGEAGRPAVHEGRHNEAERARGGAGARGGGVRGLELEEQADARLADEVLVEVPADGRPLQQADSVQNVHLFGAVTVAQHLPAAARGLFAAREGRGRARGHSAVVVVGML